VQASRPSQCYSRSRRAPPCRRSASLEPADTRASHHVHDHVLTPQVRYEEAQYAPRQGDARAAQGAAGAGRSLVPSSSNRAGEGLMPCGRYAPRQVGSTTRALPAHLPVVSTASDDQQLRPAEADPHAALGVGLASPEVGLDHGVRPHLAWALCFHAAGADHELHAPHQHLSASAGGSEHSERAGQRRNGQTRQQRMPHEAKHLRGRGTA
jgi:hypothetical protein